MDNTNNAPGTPEMPAAPDPSFNTNGSKPNIFGALRGKNFFIIGAVALVLVLIIFIVVLNSGGAKKTKTTTSNTLIIWGYDDPNVFKDIIANFQKKNSTYKMTYVKKDPSTYLNDSLASIGAGTGPDIWSIPNTWLPKYHDSLVPMASTLLADKKTKKDNVEVYQTLFPNAVSGDNIIDNDIYGMPLSIGTLVLFYNPTLVNKALDDYLVAHQNVDNSIVTQLFSSGPKTWDDLTTMTKLITKKSGSNITLSGIALGTSNNIDNSGDILTLMMMQNGAKMVSDSLSAAEFHTNQVVFGSQNFPGTSALSFYTAFANPSNDLYSWNSSMSDSHQAFADGKTAMIIDYPSATKDFTRLNPNLKFNYFAVPQVKATSNPVDYASYIDLTVTKASKNPALAWQFIDTIANSYESTSYLEQTSSTSAQLKLLNNVPSILSRQAIDSESWFMPDPVLTPPIFKNAITQVNSGKDPQTAIEYAASQVTDLLQKIKI